MKCYLSALIKYFANKYMKDHMYDIFFTLYGYIANSQLVELCTDIAEVMGSNPVQA